MRSVAIAVTSMLAMDAYARLSATGDDFNNPMAAFDPNATDAQLAAGEQDTDLVPAVIEPTADATDEFSSAVREARKPLPTAPVVQRPKGPGKYQLDYVLHGKKITETHDTIRQGLAGVRRLQSLGITPATSTNANAAAVPVDTTPDWKKVAGDPPQLRTDGPTKAEWVAAGYSPDAYPPKGYAAKS